MQAALRHLERRRPGRLIAATPVASREAVDLTVVGPEGPLAAGVVDDFRDHWLRIFGPTRAAAQLESSKAFSKAFMKRHSIPTAEYETFADPAAAHDEEVLALLVGRDADEVVAEKPVETVREITGVGLGFDLRVEIDVEVRPLRKRRNVDDIDERLAIWLFGR